jgi:hypothetical protein
LDTVELLVLLQLFTTSRGEYIFGLR